MSRVGKEAIFFKDPVKVSLSETNLVEVSAKTKSLKFNVKDCVKVSLEKDKLQLLPKDETKEAKAFSGLYRMLIFNAVKGFSEGWTKELVLNGVGYKAALSGKTLKLNLGYSHPIEVEVPEGIEVKVNKQTQLSFKSANKEELGQFTSKIRSFRPPEPYLGKGILFKGEQIKKKAGKAAATGEKK